MADDNPINQNFSVWTPSGWLVFLQLIKYAGEENKLSLEDTFEILKGIWFFIHSDYAEFNGREIASPYRRRLKIDISSRREKDFYRYGFKNNILRCDQKSKGIALTEKMFIQDTIGWIDLELNPNAENLDFLRIGFPVKTKLEEFKSFLISRGLSNKNIGEEEESNNKDIEKTRDKIKKEINDFQFDKGWEYFFSDEKDFNLFVEILTNYFLGIDYDLPNKTIKTNKRTKTNLAKLCKKLHRHSPEETLRRDEKYFDILRSIDVFSNEADVYSKLIK